MTGVPAPGQQKQRIAAMFGLIAGGYDNPAQRLFPFCADRLVSKLTPLRGHKVIDIATGHAAMAAAQPWAPVTAYTIDLSEDMLIRAQQNIDKMKLPNIGLHVMDAGALEFGDIHIDTEQMGVTRRQQMTGGRLYETAVFAAWSNSCALNSRPGSVYSPYKQGIRTGHC